MSGSLEGATPENQQKVEASIQTSFLMIVPTVFLAPIVEEFFFRKILIGHLFAKHKYIGLVVSSVIFASVHLLTGFSLVGFIMYGGLGLLLGFVYLKTNRLEASIVAHSFNNFVSYLLVLIR